jgi:microcystin-dependent protein
MSDPFIGEIRMAGFNFAPRNWALCNGQILAISQNTALFSILGTTYGGNGTQNFALPNLQARAAIGAGNGPGLTPQDLGEVNGEATVTLLSNQMPIHGHALSSGLVTPNNAAQYVATPSNTAVLGLSGPNQTYSDVASPNTTFHPSAISTYGSGQPHENRQPYLVVNFIICLAGVFPSRN